MFFEVMRRLLDATKNSRLTLPIGSLLAIACIVSYSTAIITNKLNDIQSRLKTFVTHDNLYNFSYDLKAANPKMTIPNPEAYWRYDK